MPRSTRADPTRYRRPPRGLMPGEYSPEDIVEALRDISIRLKTLEDSIAAAEKEGAQVAAELGEEGEGKFNIRPITMLYNVRRAFYGYIMMLESMGLSKDQKQTMMQLKDLMNMVVRLQQTIQMVDVAVQAFYLKSGPIGWVMLALSAGTMAGSIVYGYRGVGG